MNAKLLVPILVIILVGAGVWYWQSQMASPIGSPGPGKKACTQEAKLCSNGSYVGRTGPNCEFTVCPK